MLVFLSSLIKGTNIVATQHAHDLAAAIELDE